MVWRWRGASTLAGELAEASGRLLVRGRGRAFHMGSRRKLSISACSSATGCRASVATRLVRGRVRVRVRVRVGLRVGVRARVRVNLTSSPSSPAPPARASRCSPKTAAS